MGYRYTYIDGDIDMTYIEYYHKGAVTGNLIPACGDRAIIILDGRNSLGTMKQDAIDCNGVRRPKYDAYTINKGDSLCRSHPITPIIDLT